MAAPGARNALGGRGFRVLRARTRGRRRSGGPSLGRSGHHLPEGTARIGRATWRGRGRVPFRVARAARRTSLEEAVRRLSLTPDVLLVDATGRDHPRRAGLALELGQILRVPTIGVTRRPLLARAAAPPRVKGARTPLWLEEELVGYLLRPAADSNPIVIHAGWRTSPELAVRVVESCLCGHRTPEPLRRARQAARQARARDELLPGPGLGLT